MAHPLDLATLDTQRCYSTGKVLVHLWKKGRGERERGKVGEGGRWRGKERKKGGGTERVGRERNKH